MNRMAQQAPCLPAKFIQGCKNACLIKKQVHDNLCCHGKVLHEIIKEDFASSAAPVVPARWRRDEELVCVLSFGVVFN